MAEGRAILLLSLVVCFFMEPALAVYKICAFPSISSDFCKAIEIGNSNVSCIRATDGVQCALALKSKRADMAVLNAEEAVLISRNDDLSTYVLGDLVPQKFDKQESALEMVVVVRANATNGSFNDLRNKRYCHPGVSVSRHLTDKFLKSFENIVVDKLCNNYHSAVEQEVMNLHSFFGDSCRPGVWAQDDFVDGHLKRKFRKLCRLCDMPHICQNQLSYSSPHKQALECLRNKGDVAFVSLQSVRDEILFDNQNFDDFRFLCPDQQTMPISDTKRPCSWSKQPWDLLVARSDVAAELKPKVLDWLTPISKTGADKWQSVFRDMILGDSTIFRSQDIKPIGQFIDRGTVDRVDSNKECSNKVRWCTINDLEYEKCTWLKYAADTHGIKPPIQCVPAPNLTTCLESISKNKADAVSINTDMGFIARKIHKLSPIVFEDNSHEGNYKIIAIVKANSSPAIKSFQDLRNKKACFPEYNGLSWLAFVNLAYEKKLLAPKQCPEKYFLSACAPGADRSFLIDNQLPQYSLCSLCSKTAYCYPSKSRKERNVRAMNCLDNGGDVAFINYESLLTGHSYLNSSINISKYNVICRNGSIVTGTLDVDNECALGIGIRAEIMGREKMPLAEALNLSELFLQLNNWFGTTSPTKEGVIRMFGNFKNGTNVLFKDTTIALVQAQVPSYDMINSYKELLSNVSQTCTGSASSLMPPVGLLLIILISRMIYK